MTYNKVKFEIEEYKCNIADYSMHCKTEEEANEFCAFLGTMHLTWQDGKSFSDFTRWNIFRENTCYFFNTGEFAHIEEIEAWNKAIRNSDFNDSELKCIILEFDNFEWE